MASVNLDITNLVLGNFEPQTWFGDYYTTSVVTNSLYASNVPLPSRTTRRGKRKIERSYTEDRRSHAPIGIRLHLLLFGSLFSARFYLFISRWLTSSFLF